MEKKNLFKYIVSCIFVIAVILFMGNKIEVHGRVYENLIFTQTPLPMETVTPNSTATPTVKPTKRPVIVGNVNNVRIRTNYNSLTVSWKAAKNAKKYKIERRVKGKYIVVATVSKCKFTDHNVKFQTYYSYRIRGVSDNVNGKYSSSHKAILKLKKSTIKGVRKGGNKISLRWNKVEGADGYIIYMSNYKDKGFKPIKYIKSSKRVQYTKSKVKAEKRYYFKVRSYVYSYGKKYSVISNPLKIDRYIVIRIKNKIKLLRKRYPIYSYWNHVGVSVKSKEMSEIVTKKPCTHFYSSAISLTCNYYNCPNGIIGYQCYGFAWKLSDEIFGKKAKIYNHRSFSKAKIGDVIRYQGHSVIIIEKHTDYIKVAEANFNRPCMIYWDRIIWKEELKSAKYSSRY